MTYAAQIEIVWEPPRDGDALPAIQTIVIYRNSLRTLLSDTADMAEGEFVSLSILVSVSDGQA